MSDASISTILSSIKSKAEWVRNDSYQLRQYVDALKYQRNFETEAEDAIGLAEKELVDALARVRLAKAEFIAKPVEVLNEA